jgi:mycothiol synthase
VVREVLEDANGALLALEVDPATEQDAQKATAAGLVLTREVLQLRRPLPIGRSSTLPCRIFRPETDEAEFLRVNNLAFAWHPDQSDWTHDRLAARITQPWFSPEGFLIHEKDGRMLAFCWTKVHPAHDEDPELGEIYVIGVDPAAHGRGLGTEMVLAGLDHLSSLGITTGMLHVEADNHAALQMYDRLGFSRHSAHQWWTKPDAPVGATELGPDTNP